MSVTWRQRLAERRLELGLEGEEYDYLKKYMEHYCKESDARAEKLCDRDMLKTVDQVMNSMADPEFDRFTSGLVADVSRKLGRDDIAMAVEIKQKKKDNEKKGGTPETIQSDDDKPKQKEEPIPA